MKKLSHRTKKVTAFLLSAVVIAAGCAISASAAAQSWTHNVSVSAAGSTSFVFNANYRGTRTDTFASYPTIYNGKDHSEGYCSVVQKSTTYKRQKYYIQSNSASHPTYNFGTLPVGSSTHYYDNSFGGFSSSVTTSQQY